MEVAILLVVIALVAYLVLGRKRSGRMEAISTDHMPESFVVFDLETTGLDPSRHEIIEVAAVRYRKGSASHDTYQNLVKPAKKVPKKITDITGITQEMVERDGKQLPAVLSEFSEFVGSLRLVTFNAEFDMGFLHAACDRSGLPRPANPVSCALKMTRRAFPNRDSYRLDDLARDGGIASGQAHRALEDARRALIVYAAATAKLKSPS
jgi:DNA polymerase III subunit epsilon